MKTRILLIAVPVVLAAALAAATLPGSASSAAAEPGGITVQGTASVTSVPDRAELSFGVESQGQTAKAALAANAVEMRKVIAAVKAAGGTDVKTQSVSLSPRYNETNEVQAFVATNSVSATIKGLARAGAVIDAAVNAGANQIYGPSLSSSDQTELYRQALKAAVANARASAQVLAAAANVSLGRVTAIVENGGGPQPLAYAADKAMVVESTPIEPGKQQTTASISVTFAVS
ncbi:MAG TPA: SIMPL domain-containing protein [Gaiellaceae bacterium]|nr:SIMPL domain-containing protein [Gaiellaceae bacterium]